MIALYIAITIIGGIIYTELVGYILHIILHSNKSRYLSKSHMIHHLRLYGPKMPQLTKIYKVSAIKRMAISGIGLEWLLPVAIIIGGTVLITWLIGIHYLYISILVGVILFWGYFLFGYMHDKLHIEGYWMQDNKYLKNWFLNVRRLHIIHHLQLTDDGRMTTNYGICFFVYDKIFGSYRIKMDPFNEKGFQEASKTYDYIFEIEI